MCCITQYEMMVVVEDAIRFVLEKCTTVHCYQHQPLILPDKPKKLN
jgi:hypothetical protein